MGGGIAVVLAGLEQAEGSPIATASRLRPKPGEAPIQKPAFFSPICAWRTFAESSRLYSAAMARLT